MSDRDGLPSYEDVLAEEEKSSSNKPSSRPPPPRPPRPSKNSSSGGAYGNSSSSSHSNGKARPQGSYNNVSRPPVAPPTSNSRPIPWVYPTGFYCDKCHNTGYKIKNGHSCKSCWKRFANQQNVSYVSNPYYAPQAPIPMPMQPFMAPQQGVRPLMVRPGDPRLGGVLCGVCRGTGRTRFLLDEDLCTTCNGIGRIITGNNSAHVTF